MKKQENELEKRTRDILFQYYSGDTREFFACLHPEAVLLSIGKGRLLLDAEEIRQVFKDIGAERISYDVEMDSAKSWEIIPDQAYGIYISSLVRARIAGHPGEWKQERLTVVWGNYEEVLFPDGEEKSGWFIKSIHVSIAVESAEKELHHSFALLEKGEDLTKEIILKGLDGSTSYLRPYQIVRAYAERMYITIYLESGEKIVVQKSLTELEKELGMPFVRIHRSHLVNIRYAVQIKNYKLVLGNGTELPIAQKRYKDIKKLYTER